MAWTNSFYGKTSSTNWLCLTGVTSHCSLFLLQSANSTLCWTTFPHIFFLFSSVVGNDISPFHLFTVTSCNMTSDTAVITSHRICSKCQNLTLFLFCASFVLDLSKQRYGLRILDYFSVLSGKNFIFLVTYRNRTIYNQKKVCLVFLTWFIFFKKCKKIFYYYYFILGEISVFTADQWSVMGWPHLDSEARHL